MSSAFALPETTRPADLPWGVLASLGVHSAFALAVFWVSPLRPLIVPPPRPVAVEIVTERQYEVMVAPAQPLVPAGAAQPEIAAAPAVSIPAPATGAPTIAKVDRGVVTATEFYAARILAEPGMARIRAALGHIDPAERIVQLCNIEGLEQIRRAEPGYDPDTLVAYAMNDTTLEGMTLGATGGAFRSRRKWYGIIFQCTAAADYSGVTAFSFKLGAPIPEDEWEEHNLNAEDADE